MRREFVVLRALEPTGVPTPRAVHLCEDADVIGAPFMLMEFLDGPVIADAATARSLTTAQARLASETLIDVLAELHALDPARIGLATFGRPEGYLARQIRRWRSQWASSTDAPSPELDELAAILEANVPARSRAALVHGDYRLGNVILAPGDAGRIAGVIDWEMSTLGDPLTDIGLLLAYWSPASDGVTAGGHPIIANPGFLDPDALVERYARHFAIDPGELSFYRVFGLFKLAVIGQTIVARHLLGKAVGDGLPAVAVAVERLIAAGRLAAAEIG
jgi:aminoglycoside phosphotransferase (APT) family kinase protein